MANDPLQNILHSMLQRMEEINNKVENLFRQVQENLQDGNINAASKRLVRDEVAAYIESLDKFEASAMPGGYNSRLKLVNQAVDMAGMRSGDIALEFGVFQGESLALISRKLPSCKIYGFDSFEGLPASEQIWKKGQFNNPEGLKYAVGPNTELVKGWFNETLEPFMAKHDMSKVKFVHVDCDIYSSAKYIFDTLFDQLPPDIVILFDEYWNYKGWKGGEFKAFHEWRAQSKRDYTYLGYMESGPSVAIRLH